METEQLLCSVCVLGFTIIEHSLSVYSFVFHRVLEIDFTAVVYHLETQDGFFMPFLHKNPPVKQVIQGLTCYQYQVDGNMTTG